MSLSVRSLIERARAAQPAHFAARLGSLVLIGPPTDGEEHDGASPSWRFLTEKGSTPLAHNPLGQLLDSVVYPLRKRSASGAFGGVILVGRAESNDVCIPHSSISKLHARIEVGREGLVLKDAGSTNGTFYDGVAVEKDGPVPLEAGHRPRFGDVELTLYDTVRLHAILTRFADSLART